VTTTDVSGTDVSPRETPAGTGRLAGKVAAVTGATSGSGLAIARLFAREGARLVLLARGADRLKDLEAELGPAAVGIPTDVGDPDSVRAAFAEIATRHGKLDILINNAGLERPCRIEDLADEQILAQVRCNYLGPVFTSRSAIPLMREAGGGTIINTSSESTFEVFPYQSIYCSTKASLEAFGRSMNFEYEKEEIRTVTLIQGVALGEGGGVQDWDHNPAFKETMWPRLLAEGTIERVMGKHGGQDVDHVAEVHLFVATRPPGQKLDVVRSRSY
jgi:NAD(P)-dependent dehydrogenase (short-subunit alcohol dehydrogenase family)